MKKADLETLKTQGKERSPQWPKIRKAFLKDNPKCAVCGGSKKLEAHHRLPFDRAPSLELNQTNLIALCEGIKAVNCHLHIGHLNSFQSYNPDVEKDAETWKTKIQNRP